MRYMVAGGAGFIGSNLSQRLLNDGHEVICIDNLVTGRTRNNTQIALHPQFQFIEADLIAPLGDLPRVDGIFHLASPASPPGYQRYALETMRVNSEGTMHLLDRAVRDGAAFLYASTSEAYGDPLLHPQREDYRGNVSSTGPRSMYDEAKRYGEALTMLFHRKTGVDTRIIRIFNTYGPNSDPSDGRLVPNLITQALRHENLTIYGDGSQTRSLCYVSDLVEGLIRAISSRQTSGKVINLGNPEEHTILEFATIIRELCESSSKLAFGPAAVGDDPQRRRPDISLARELLSWEPSVPLQHGLMNTIAYFKQELRTGAK